MGEKSELFHCDEKMLTYDAAVILQGIVDGLRQGKLPARTKEGGQACLDLPLLTTVEMRLKEKSKEGKSKRKLSIELVWKEGEEKPGVDLEKL